MIGTLTLNLHTHLELSGPSLALIIDFDETFLYRVGPKNQVITLLMTAWIPYVHVRVIHQVSALILAEVDAVPVLVNRSPIELSLLSVHWLVDFFTAESASGKFNLCRQFAGLHKPIAIGWKNPRFVTIRGDFDFDSVRL